MFLIHVSEKGTYAKPLDGHVTVVREMLKLYLANYFPHYRIRHGMENQK